MIILLCFIWSTDWTFIASEVVLLWLCPTVIRLYRQTFMFLYEGTFALYYRSVLTLQAFQIRLNENTTRVEASCLQCYMYFVGLSMVFHWVVCAPIWPRTFLYVFHLQWSPIRNCYVSSHLRYGIEFDCNLAGFVCSRCKTLHTIWNVDTFVYENDCKRPFLLALQVSH